jgi:hypothetical protein
VLETIVLTELTAALTLLLTSDWNASVLVLTEEIAASAFSQALPAAKSIAD